MCIIFPLRKSIPIFKSSFFLAVNSSRRLLLRSTEHVSYAANLWGQLLRFCFAARGSTFRSSKFHAVGLFNPNRRHAQAPDGADERKLHGISCFSFSLSTCGVILFRYSCRIHWRRCPQRKWVRLSRVLRIWSQVFLRPSTVLRTLWRLGWLWLVCCKSPLTCWIPMLHS